MNIPESIKRALPLYSKHKYFEEKDLETALNNLNIPSPLAYKLIEFIPLAFGRVFLKDLKVKHQDYFVRYITLDGKIIEKQRRKLTDEPVYREALKIASEMAANKEMAKEFLAIAFCSAEVRTVNEMELKGSKPENLVLTAPYLQWNENGENLDSKEYSSWWRFWG